jgi:hypothetical protein
VQETSIKASPRTFSASKRNCLLLKPIYIF